eukprot:GDKI01030690.1.p1 GENE.GDKI01030690.1~~GDKI01030690.1.p1  ORF type:complete len:388 (-),score=85.05 GDKI01030690.1:27-1190(-)
MGSSSRVSYFSFNRTTARMFSAKIWSTDTLYNHLNAFLAHAAPHKVVFGTRNDYRDPSFLRVSLDYGTFSLDLKDHNIRCQVEHVAPKDDNDAHMIISSESYEMNVRLVDLALRSFVKAPDQRIVSVFSWEQAWHQRQAVWVTEHTPSKTQKKVLEDVEWFYKNPKHFHDLTVPYQRGIVLSGPASSGKHWLARNLALQNQKSMCYLPVTEVTYSTVGPAIACAPLNSIVVIDNLVTFYSHIPSTERPVFLKHLETTFNTNVHDPRGLLIVILAPVSIPSELEKFLLNPARFQKKFELSLSGKEQMSEYITKHMPECGAEDVTKIVNKLLAGGVSHNVVQWFFAHHKKENTPHEQLIPALEQLAGMIKEERSIIDAASGGHRERLYS